MCTWLYNEVKQLVDADDDDLHLQHLQVLRLFLCLTCAKAFKWHFTILGVTVKHWVFAGPGLPLRGFS